MGPWKVCEEESGDERKCAARVMKLIGGKEVVWKDLERWAARERRRGSYAQSGRKAGRRVGKN